jgi:YHS domain-containing protein
MIRFVLYLFLAVLVISVIRSIAGILGKAIGGASPAHRPAAEPRKAGELKRDPVCGTYISTATSVKRTVRGEVLHFCSVECSEKYAKGDRRI